MRNITRLRPTLPGFYLPKRGRKKRTPQQVLSDKLADLRNKSFKQLGEIFEPFVPAILLKQEQSGTMSRRRLFTKENTFWAFFGQILDADGGCKEVVKKLQSHATAKGLRIPSSSTASYCAARKKLDVKMLGEIFRHTTTWIEAEPVTNSQNNRRIVVVDGTGASMPDTVENQAVWPQPSNQKAGCGFPTARICAYFLLESGVMLSYAVGNKKSSELPLFRQQWDTFREGDIFLGDKGFCSFFDIAKLNERGIDSVVTLARRKPVTRKECVRELGQNDLLIKWDKPRYNKVLSYSRESWTELPDYLVMRQIKVQVNQPGFRSKEFYIVTTLTDPEQYPSTEIAKLYLKRWNVELFFRDIKSTMGFDILRCQSPEMIRKEMLMYFIAYNCIRRLIYKVAKGSRILVRNISFKGSLQTIRSWLPRLTGSTSHSHKRFEMLGDLALILARSRISDRPGRSEPRCLKRRPKPFQLLTKPRGEMQEIQHRNRYRAEMA